MRTKLSSSTLDAVMVNLMKNINKVPADFSKRYRDMIKLEKLEELTTIGTTDPTTVRERFEFVNQNLFK